MFFTDDLLAGFIKGCISKKHGVSRVYSGKIEALLTVKRSIFIWSGLFKGSFKNIISRLSWEILQTVIGFVSAHFANWFLPVRNIIHLHGATVIESGGVGGSVSFGTYILLHPKYVAEVKSYIFLHEFGHTLQSREAGPVYLFKYGIPSLLTDNFAWMELDANIRSMKHFPQYVYMLKQEGIQLPKHKKSPKIWEYIAVLLLFGFVLVPYMNTPKNRLRRQWRNKTS